MRLIVERSHVLAPWRWQSKMTRRGLRILLLMLAATLVVDSALLLGIWYCHVAVWIIVAWASAFVALCGLPQFACLMLRPQGTPLISPAAFKRGEFHAQLAKLKDAGFARETRDAWRLYVVAVVLFYVHCAAVIAMNAVLVGGRYMQ